ncbi:type VI secretion system Vgr family protein, partial [Escherichia albertii]
QAWAGTGFGNLAIPRVGQEVIVDFLNGDPDQPIIMGRTYHEDNRTPGSLPGTKTQMTIRSKTYMGSGFNELKFDDATGKEQVYIHAQKNMDTEVLNDRTTLVANNHDESVGAIQTIGVGQDQNIFIGGNQQKMIKGSRGMMINGPRYTEINAVSSSEMEGAKGDAAALLALAAKAAESAKNPATDTLIVQGNITMESQTGNIQINTAGGSIIIGHDGAIAITGTSIVVNGQFIGLNAAKG